MVMDTYRQKGQRIVNRRRRLSERRKNQGLSQERLAQIIGVDTSTVARWERGETDPLPVYRPRLADAIKVTVEDVAALLAEADGLATTVAPAPAAVVPVQHPGAVSSYERLEGLDTVTAYEEPDTNRRDALRLATTLFMASPFSTAMQPGAGLPVRGASPRPIGSAWATGLSEAILDPVGAARRAASGIEQGSGEATRQLAPVTLRALVDQATRVSFVGDHVRLAEQLPSLIGRIELASVHGIGSDGASSMSLLSDMYALAGWVLIKADNAAGACITAHRAIRAAEEGEDALRVAATTRCLAEVYMRAGRLEDAAHTALLAAARLETAPVPDHPTALCLRGAALLSAAAAAARRGDRREAITALNAAAVQGERLNEERAELGTAFGPSNVAIHRVAIAIETGDAKEALAQSSSVDLTNMPAYLGERRARYLIDVARAYTQAGDDTATIGALTDAERIAPDEVRTHRHTHALIQTLLPRERRSSGLRELAARCQVRR
jgi:transcriptional regulator with XRE-family HTH domain/tetratricopeptide (TPR) repeat protein